ncbi:MAG TPA: hypothetical protein VFX70_02925 [Mycobacteriales bacterium]|nr:hypothetical protein [Mycobacteriales bacterium]
MFDDEHRGFLAGDEYRRAAALRDTAKDGTGEPERDGEGEQVDEKERPDERGPVDGGPDRPGAGGHDRLDDLLRGRFEDGDPPGCPAPCRGNPAT